MNTPLFTRREFLQTLTLAGLSMSLPAFLVDSLPAQSSTATKGEAEKILVVLQLGGGNDGLNAVVPYADDLYHSQRKGLALAKENLLVLDDHHGLNKGLTPLKELFDAGQLALVHGVGYPNPNRSHFRSMEIWQTAVDSDRYSNSGWVGRYFDNCCGGAPPAVRAVNVGKEAPQAFTGKKGVGVSFEQPAQFGWANDRGTPGRLAFNALNHTADDHHAEGATIDFLRHTTANAMTSSDQVLRAGKTGRKGVDYPNSRLAGQLKTIATLIAGGLPTKLYYTSMTGFDTHANQLGQHENLLRQFAGATQAFMADLKAIGVADRVQIMCFSEFGRRVEANGSRGTDHGTAGPMFLLGAGIKPGIHGKPCDLGNLDEGDLKHTVDFRSIHAEVVRKWLGGDAKAVLGRDWPELGVLA
jgi:uncharacterized protein (DUF1501 family)